MPAASLDPEGQSDCGLWKGVVGVWSMKWSRMSGPRAKINKKY